MQTSEMERLIQEFPGQLQQALEISEKISFQPSKPIQNVLICGLGGSGIGGSLVENLLRDKLQVPVISNKAYFIPGWVSKNTLVVFCSYSGNTEETLGCFEQSLEIDCERFIVTSGGKLGELALEQNVAHVIIPGGNPPRSALGFSSIQLITLFERAGLAEAGVREKFVSAISFIQNEQENIRKSALELAHQLKGKTPVLYIWDRLEAVAIRWRQQLNENAKILCWHHVVPEMNHNELVGWRDQRDDLAVLFLRNECDPERVQLRYGINQEVIQKYNSTLIEVFSKGGNMVERAFYLIHLGDWLSTELANIREQNAYEVNVIDYLKGELAKHG